MFNRKPTRECLGEEENASPKISVESIFLACITDEFECRDMMLADVPNAFMQAMFPREPGEDRTVMKIMGKLADLSVHMHPEVHKDFVALEKGKRALCMETLKVICGVSEAALLWHRQFRNNLEVHGFAFNNHDPCVENKTVKGKQQTMRFHVDDLMLSHVDKAVNSEFLMWLNCEYGEHAEVTSTRGDEHNHLGGITFRDGEFTLDITGKVRDVLEEFPTKFKDDDLDKTKMPAA